MIAIILVVAGVAVVGIASQTDDSGGDETTSTTGIILILVAQIFTGI